MTTRKQIENVYEIILRAVPSRIRDELKLLPISHLRKNGLDIVRGRIEGKLKRRIWSAKWCFYEIGIGYYPAAPTSSAGGIGFVSYPNSKECGGGKHRKSIIKILGELAQRDKKFPVADHSVPFQGTFTYYQASQFPVDQAAADLAVLIADTFEDFNRLII